MISNHYIIIGPFLSFYHHSHLFFFSFPTPSPCLSLSPSCTVCLPMLPVLHYIHTPQGPVWSKGYIETWPGEDTTASKALSTVVQGTTVGLTTMKPGGSFRWTWGDLRGGTPALYIGDNRYLTFFHSSNEPPATGRTDYFFMSPTISFLNVRRMEYMAWLGLAWCQIEYCRFT